MFLLDTNVLSELRKAGDGKADPAVMAWSASVDAVQFYISVVTVMEIEIGILRLERRDGAQAAKLRTWFDKIVLPSFAARILEIDTAVALRCACLHVPDPQSDRDALIAATALAHGLMVVTRNAADFAATGVSLLNPWDAGMTLQDSAPATT